MTAPAIFAAQEFKRREALARDAIRQGTMARLDAEARLWPWLAIGLAAGAAIRDMVPDAPDQAFLADGICEPDEYREILAKARDAVIEANRADAYGRGILALAAALNCRPWHPRADAALQVAA